MASSARIYPAGQTPDTAPHDELGTAAAHLRRCREHDTIYRTGGACLDCEREASDD